MANEATILNDIEKSIFRIRSILQFPNSIQSLFLCKRLILVHRYIYATTLKLKS